MLRRLITISLLFVAAGLCAGSNPQVVLNTNMGNITLELYPQAAPITVDNFLHYVNTGFYDGLLFHRVIPDFMIQGGGYFLSGTTIYTAPVTAGPIINESGNGLSNLRGTIAMARTSEPHSATSQFFINQVDNLRLDRANAQDGYGYCVFGRVVDGMDVVDAIAGAPRIYVNFGLSDFPYPPIGMYQVWVVPRDLSYDSNFAADTQVNLADFAVFAANWLNDGCASANAFCSGTDLDFSGGIDFVDLDIFLRHFSRTVGYEPAASDIAPNNVVDAADLAHIAENWLHMGCTPENDYCRKADLNRSGAADMADLALFAGNWLIEY
jgi:cyclophilin family peptidyl-prolyl cis-trans isomerase